MVTISACSTRGDVYKRQGYTPAYVEEPAEHDVLLARIARGEGMILLSASFSAIQRQGVVSVSYTHLDVYKRQY